MTRASPEGILVAWVSVNHRAAPFVSALSDPKSVLAGKIGRLVLCYRDGPEDEPSTKKERDALRETIDEVRRALDPVCPEIVRRPWKTDASPIDHSAIRPFAERVLSDVRAQAPDAPIYIHVSPGTPAMHAIWLVLATTGFVSDPVHLVQGIAEKDRKPGDPPLIKVDFPLDTWLRRYQRHRPDRPSDIDDGHLWDPSTAASPALRDTLAMVARVAPLRVPVLIVGERGTGKTTLAAQLRARSPFQRKDGDDWPLVVCGQFRVNPQLAQSELFGHKKGAFTGATHDREGLLERAHGDSIFFDEIGDIDRDTQRLLMAAVEGRGFTRLGDNVRRDSRFRLISATNRPVGELRGGVLDEDFFDRIAVFVLRVPPVRECREDLPQLWRSVFAAARRSAEVEPDGWRLLLDHAGLLEGLRSHPMPGNIRDLQRVAVHALAALEAGVPADEAVRDGLACLDSGGPLEVERTAELAARLPLEDGELEDELRRTELAWLDAALQKAGGNQSEAARLLGLKRKTFADRLDRSRRGE